MPTSSVVKPSEKTVSQVGNFKTLQVDSTPTPLPSPSVLTFTPIVQTHPLIAVDKTPNGTHHTLNMTTDTPSSGSIQIPAQGSFNVILEAGGTKINVIDNNALDGVARVQMPSGVLDGFIDARGKVNQQIQYKDSLYAQLHNLIHPNGKPQSFRIGKRSWPIPADWQAEPYALSFQNQGASNVSFRWYPTTGEADMPPGIAKIGPKGGTVELPGVAKLVISAGALNTTQTIRLHQRLQAPQMLNYAIDGTADIQDFITPIVEIEPAGLNLLSPAQLTLPTNMSRVGQNHPVVTQLVSPLDENTWSVVPAEQPDPYLHTFALPITQLGTYAKVMPQWIKNTDQYVPYEPEAGFRTQSVGDCSFDNSRFTFIYDGNNPKIVSPAQQLGNLYCYGNQVWDYYTSLLQQAGARSFPYVKLPVYLQTTTEGIAHAYWYPVPIINPTPGNLAPSGYSYMSIPYTWDESGSGNLNRKESESFAHELWHIFQYAALSNYPAASNLFSTLVLAGSSRWSLEGAAEHMGASAACQFGNDCEPDHFNDSLENNQDNMSVTVNARPNEYSSVGFFNYLVNTGEGDLLLAKLAIKTGSLDPTSELDTILGGQLTEKYKEYGYSAFSLQDYTFLVPTRILPPPTNSTPPLNESHTKENPKTLFDTVKRLATKYQKVSLENPSKKAYRVLVKGATQNDKTKLIAMVVGKDNQVVSKTDIEPGNQEFTEIADFDTKNPEQFLVLAASNGAWGAFDDSISSYSFNLALELPDAEAVSIKITPDNKLYTYGSNNGGKFRTVEVTVRDTEGKPMPLGTPIYVKAVTKGRLFGQQMIDVEHNKTWSNHEAQFFTDESGKFKFDYKLQGLVDPSEYSKEPRTSAAGANDPWPNLDAPNTLFRICSYKYRNSKPGWGGDCDKILFPTAGTDPISEDPLKGRIFWMGPVSAEFQPDVIYGFMNGTRYTFTVKNVKDKNGETVPDGTPVYVRYPYWLTGRGQTLFPSEGQGYYVQANSGATLAQLITHGGTASFEAQTRYIGECWGAGKVFDTFQLIGTHTSHLYPFYPRDILATATLHYQLPIGCPVPK